MLGKAKCLKTFLHELQGTSWPKYPHGKNCEEDACQEWLKPNARDPVDIPITIGPKSDADENQKPYEWSDRFFTNQKRCKKRNIGRQDNIRNCFRAGIENHEIGGGEGCNKKGRDERGVDFFQLPRQTERHKSKQSAHGEPLFIRKIQTKCAKHGRNVVEVIAWRDACDRDLFEAHLPLIDDIAGVEVDEGKPDKNDHSKR